MKPQLIIFEWDGEAMQPLPRFRKTCDQEFTVGEQYRMDVQEGRSSRSHKHYFAMIHEAWMNLPQHLAERFPSPDHLRKWALVRSGYCDQKFVPLSTEEEARHVAQVMRDLNDFAVIVVSIDLITVYTAKSQSLKAMGKADFQASKDAVLNVISEMIGTTQKQLKANVGA